MIYVFATLSEILLALRHFSKSFISMFMRIWRALGLCSMYEKEVSSANMFGRQKRRLFIYIKKRSGS